MVRGGGRFPLLPMAIGEEGSRKGGADVVAEGSRRCCDWGKTSLLLLEEDIANAVG